MGCHEALKNDTTPTNLKTVLVAAVILVDHDGRILLAQRPEGKVMAGLWELPGGKLEENETPEAALVRELKEELDITTAPSCLAPLTFASHSYENAHLLMPVYVCRVWEGYAKPMEGQTLAWVKVDDIEKYDMPPADIPLIPFIRDWL